MCRLAAFRLLVRWGGWGSLSKTPAPNSPSACGCAFQWVNVKPMIAGFSDRPLVRKKTLYDDGPLAVYHTDHVPVNKCA